MAPRSPSRWPDPRRVCDACGAKDPQYRCRGCEGAVAYCSSACQRTRWRSHKRDCLPLAHATTQALARATPALRREAEYHHPRGDDDDDGDGESSSSSGPRCWCCLEPGTPSDPLYSGGCGCRGGATVGHVACFKEAARTQILDEANFAASRWLRCGVCQQSWTGYLQCELLVALSRHTDAACLVDDDAAETDRTRSPRSREARLRALFHLASALSVAGEPRVAMRIFLKHADVAEATYGPEHAAKLTACSLVRVAASAARLKQHDLALSLLEPFYAAPAAETPWNRSTVARLLATTLLDLASAQSDASKRREHAQRAERVLREAFAEDAKDPERRRRHAAGTLLGVEDATHLAQALYLSDRPEEALRVNDDSLVTARRVLGPDHAATRSIQTFSGFLKDLLALSASRSSATATSIGAPRGT